MQSLDRLPGLVAAVCVLILTACQPGLAPTAAVTCLSQFEATVHHGPNAGLAVNGKLLFTLDHAGALTGGIAAVDGSEIPVVGQANGRAVNLSLTVGEQKFLFGVGSAENPINTCTGYWGGGFTGPEAGDSGDWLASDGRNIIDPTNANVEFDPNRVVGLSLIEDPNTGNFNLSLPGGGLGGTVNFECIRGQGLCHCEGTDDCIRLAETGICKERIQYPTPNSEHGSCIYREPARN